MFGPLNGAGPRLQETAVAKNSEARASVVGIEQRDISISKYLICEWSSGGGTERAEGANCRTNGLPATGGIRGIIPGEGWFGRKWGSGPMRVKDVFSGKFAEKVVFAKKREKTAHKFISDFECDSYSEVSGHSI
jgi:hypothetical protein